MPRAPPAALLQQITAAFPKPPAHHIIAFSGGVDSTLVASLLHRHYYDNDNHAVTAVLGVSPSLPDAQRSLAHKLAGDIGVEIREVETSEGENEDYLANDGTACFHCKNTLYSTLEEVSKKIIDEGNNNVIMYNGTNADDHLDPTRLGLVSARNFEVRSPLQELKKKDVRRLSKFLGLNNWDYASSPCLRSRLEVGVEAKAEHLQRVEAAEEFVRQTLSVDPRRGLRVRLLAGGRGMVELETTSELDEEQKALIDGGVEDVFRELGFELFGGVRELKSGGLSVKVENFKG